MKTYHRPDESLVMALRIGTAIGRGIRRTLNPMGGLLMVLSFVYVLVLVGAANTLVAAGLPPAVRDQAGIGLTLPVPTAVAAAVVPVTVVFGLVIFLAATRAFTRRPAEAGAISADLFTRRIVRALVSAIGANVVVSVSVLIGFVLFVVPGLFLSVSFVFVVFAIGVEDARAIEAMRRSWSIARGNRWRLLALVLITGVGTGLFGSIGSLVSVVDPVLGQVVSLVLTAPVAVFSYGVIADAYVQLRDGSSGGDGGSSHEAEDGRGAPAEGSETDVGFDFGGE